ncbi:bombyxin G-1-like [Aricia agestis]|uniref:bombyxin G-1-like n=1 Tax=Aricia agestis TaxID=91739 RepID=UPI001C2067CA|nr:bombyxin G-1-like [Aricia agestis]XP_041970211.1 bombyxin G-1-like [Aricia agestis]
MRLLMMVSCLAVASVASEKPVILCGRQLANRRLILCYGDKDDEKRMYSDSFLDSPVSEEDWFEEWPWQGRRGGLSAGWERYKRGGLADECCLKPCTTDVILNYC